MKPSVKNSNTLFSVFKKNAQEKNYLFNKDTAFVNELMDGLFENLKRFGYTSCPCRLSTGDYSKDADIICPCDYMEGDIEKYGACFCGLYVSKSVYDGKSIISSIPESRPKEKIFNKISNTLNNKIKEMTVWKCSVCGYEHTGEEPPEKCPKCGVSKAVFFKL